MEFKLWNGSSYNPDISHRIVGGHINFARPFGLGSTEASVEIHADSEASAFSEFPKGLKVMFDTTLTGDRLDTSLFAGYIDRTAWNESKQTVRLTVKDFLYLSLDKKVGPVLFLNKAVSDVLDWVADQIGVNLRILPDAAGSKYDPILPYFYWEDVTIQNILSDIARDLGGKVYLASGTEPHTLVVEYGCLYTDYSTSAIFEFDMNDVEDVDIDYPPRASNVFEVEGVQIKEVSGTVFEGANYENPWTIPAGGIGVDDEHYIEFEAPVIYIDEYVFDADAGITFDETVWESNFVDGDPTKPLINPFKAKIKITATSEGEVWTFKVLGKAIHEDRIVETIDNSASSPERTWKIQSKMIIDDPESASPTRWIKRRVTWEAAKKEDEFRFTLVTSDVPMFGPRSSTSAYPEYIIDLSGAKIAVINIVYDFDSETYEIEGVGDRSGYDPTTTDHRETILIPVKPIVQMGDGEAPAVPTGLALTAFGEKNRSYVKATWDANTEEDIFGYEFRWSYDNSNWKNGGVVNNNEVVIEVTTQWTSGTDYYVYVQIRALDIENLKSNWSASANAKILYDTTAPGMPGAITATGGVGLIYIKWGAVYDSDVEQYFIYRKIQVSNGGPFSDWIAIATVKGTEYIDESVEYHIQNSPEDPTYPNQWRKYIYAVRAADYSNNGSSRREMSTANAVYATQATGPDIAVKAIKANHLEVAIDLAVGRMVKVGSNIQIGADVGPAGSTFDGIYVTDGTNYVKMSASFIKLKANLILGQGDNEIYFEDAGIHLKDAGFGAEGGRLQYFGNTPEDTGETQKVFYDLLYHKDSSGNLDWSNLLLRTDISNKYCTIKMEARNGTNYYEKMGLISTILAKSTTGSIYPEIQFRIYSNDEGYITASHPFKLPTYDLNTSLPTLPCGCIALKELTTGNFWLVWSDGSRWFAPDGRTLLA